MSAYVHVQEERKGDKMKCEFDYCIYNRNFECIVDKPEINSQGMCDTCIVISLDKDFLEKEKERQLQEIESRWAEGTDK